jgi:uncharacterized lipoprotein YmbA
MTRRWIVSAGGAVLALAAGCLSPPPPPPPVAMYCLDGRPSGKASVAAPSSAAAAGAQLRLRHVRAPSYLDDRIVWRDSEVRIGFYSTRKWCEPPASTVERALGHALFTTGGFVRAEEKAPELEVELTAFEEVLAPHHEARVALDLRIVDGDGRALPVRTIVETRSVPDRTGPAFARAMETTLEAAMARTVVAVGAALGQPPKAGGERADSPVGSPRPVAAAQPSRLRVPSHTKGESIHEP